MTLCECGCGQPAPIIQQTNTVRGYKKGQPHRFVMGHNGRMQIRTYGYHVRYVPSHPKASSAGDIPEHILIAERALGRYMPDGVEVHHVDGNTMNNAPSNLVICQDKAYHKLLHVRARIVQAGGNPNTHKLCGMCHQPRPLADFNRSVDNKAYGLNARCRDCQREAFAEWYQKNGKTRTPIAREDN